MQSDLEQRIDEKVYTAKQETDLPALIESASPLEIGIAQGVSWYATSALVFNFGVFTNINNHRYNKRMTAHLCPTYNPPIHYLFEAFGCIVGITAHLGTEAGILITATHLLGVPGVLAYFGMKALTNYAGYRYYRRQNEKHEKSTALQNF